MKHLKGILVKRESLVIKDVLLAVEDILPISKKLLEDVGVNISSV
jgi:hypothetical protein